MFTDLILFLKVSDEQKDSVRSAYLRRHPNAFWVCILNFLTVPTSNDPIISLLPFQFPKTQYTLMEYRFLIILFCQIKVDFGDFSFLHIKPKAVRYVSGVATALLGSGGMCRLLNALEEI